ncbi:MAG: hypothetical protein LQ342_006183 [Letrouitia transgressa]|nr:MAG: hypothetical protein LQ342_006183 [Letrouitia transgressa]
MSDKNEHKKTANEPQEIEKALVNKSDNPVPVTNRNIELLGNQLLTGPEICNEFDEGDTVKLSVLENKTWRPKNMVVITKDFKQGKWIYQIRPSGDNSGKPYQDENGNDWFGEATLVWG